MKYVALLRAINVGGKNKVSMSELISAFNEYGFKDVSHYINSGNIVFSCENNDEVVVQSVCQTLIKNRFQLDIPVAIISHFDYIEALNCAPDWWNKDTEASHNVIFAIFPATIAEVYTKIGEIKPEYEKIDCCSKAIFWSALLKTFSKTRVSKVFSTSLYQSFTMRNANTALKLKEILQKVGNNK